MRFRSPQSLRREADLLVAAARVFEGDARAARRLAGIRLAQAHASAAIAPRFSKRATEAGAPKGEQ